MLMDCLHEIVSSFSPSVHYEDVISYGYVEINGFQILEIEVKPGKLCSFKNPKTHAEECLVRLEKVNIPYSKVKEVYNLIQNRNNVSTGNWNISNPPVKKSNTLTTGGSWRNNNVVQNEEQKNNISNERVDREASLSSNDSAHEFHIVQNKQKPNNNNPTVIRQPEVTNNSLFSVYIKIPKTKDAERLVSQMVQEYKSVTSYDFMPDNPKYPHTRVGFVNFRSKPDASKFILEFNTHKSIDEYFHASFKP